MVTPEITGPRQAKRRATEAIAEIVSNSHVAEKIATNIKSKRPRIQSTKTSTSISQGKKVKSVASRKRDDDEDDEGDEGDDDSIDGTVVEYSWPEEPLSVIRARTHAYYNQIRLSLTSPKRKRVFISRHGGSIRLLTRNGKQLFCRVNRFISNRSNDRELKVEGHWLLSRKDIRKHFGNAVMPDCQQYMDKLQHNELVLTNTSCTLDIAGIEGNIRLLYLQPNQPTPTDTPENTYICRFTLDIDTARRTLEWGVIDPLTTDQSSVDDADEEFIEENNHDDVDEYSSSSPDTGNETDTSSSVEEVSKVAIREGGSAILRTEIRVGPKFQVKIHPFTVIPFVQSRKPMLVHKANSISDDELFLFLNNVAAVHNKYLAQNKITMEEPYTPLSQALVEKNMNEMSVDRLTGSSMSTASMLAGRRCQLMKECDSDALLEILAFHNYDTKCALEAIEGDLNRITAGWTRAEKDIFDDAFRRNNGSLRKVSKAIAPTKNVKDVIDYFFRFKVSDQFRKFQDKKRAMAVRIVECIETKKYCESLMLASNGGSVGAVVSSEDGESLEKASHWSERSAASMAMARDDRIHLAKRLLLDVKDRLGSKKMAEVASIIRQLQVCYEPDGKRFLFKLLQDQPELQRRFLEFLPKHF